MKRIMRCSFVIFWTFLFVLGSILWTGPLAVHASGDMDGAAGEERLEEDIVLTEYELEQWCAGHKESGGRVVLGGTIYITEDIYAYGNGDITIDTGPYGLVYNGGAVRGIFAVTGQGVDVPVLDILDTGSGWESWNHIVLALNITATGRDGAGGTALRVSYDDGFPVYWDELSFYEGVIRSFGTGAVGVYLAEPLDVYCFNIEADGENSVAVYAADGATLYSCKLKAAGPGAKTVSGGGEIVLDSCAADPAPTEACVIDRKIIGAFGCYFYAKQGEKAYLDTNLFTFLLSGTEEFPAVFRQFFLEWDFSLSIDTSVLGKTVIPCSLPPLFQGLGLEGDFPLEVVVDVRDPSIPCISAVVFFENPYIGEPSVFLKFWEFYERDDDNVILWRSDDGGETWYDLTDSPEIEWYGAAMEYYYGEITAPIMLQLEVIGQGESNVVTLYMPVTGGKGGIDNGDRTGVDRKIAGQQDDKDNDDTTAEQPENGGFSGDGGQTDNESANKPGGDTANSQNMNTSSRSTGRNTAGRPRDTDITSHTPGSDTAVSGDSGGGDSADAGTTAEIEDRPIPAAAIPFEEADNSAAVPEPGGEIEPAASAAEHEEDAPPVTPYADAPVLRLPQGQTGLTEPFETVMVLAACIAFLSAGMFVWSKIRIMR